ncbi:MAG: hypothetical protein AB8F34_16010 [Akkermansiaceae bacterium]
MSSESMSPYQPPESGMQSSEVASATQSGIPKVFGILHLVFGGLGLVFGLFAIVSALFTEQMQKMQFATYSDELKEKMMEAMQPVYETQKWDLASSCFSLVLATIMIVAGIKLVKYRRQGLKISNIYSALSVVHKLAAVGIVLAVKAPAMKQVGERLEDIGGAETAAMSSMIGPIAIVTGIVTAVLMAVYPILCYFLLNKKQSKDSLS